MLWKIATGVLALFYLAFLLPLYLRKEKRNGIEQAIVPKLALSFTFCIIGLIGIAVQSCSAFAVLIYSGLIFSLAGDYYLIFVESNSNKFIRGVLSFGVAQVLYITAMALAEGFSLWEFLATAVILLALAVFNIRCKPDMAKAAIPLTVYATLVTFMASKAMLMLISPLFLLEAQLLFSVGALLFLISDMFLGLWRYSFHKHLFRNIVGICYFVGQLMIASSLLFL